MTTNEDVELLKAVMAVAVADGELRRSEMGVIKGLAARIGVGRVTFDAMLGAAEAGEPIADNILIRSPERARSALELLVAQARIDGEISDEERGLLVRIATSLGITGDDFQAVYQAGVKRADKIRKSREGRG
jgi:tellurite resistance protein